jgi:xanthine dehydrogenase large subunit
MGRRRPLRTHGPSTCKIPGSRDVPPIFNVRLLSDAPRSRGDDLLLQGDRPSTPGDRRTPPLILAISVWLAIGTRSRASLICRLTPKLDASAPPEGVLAAIYDLRARKKE